MCYKKSTYSASGKYSDHFTFSTLLRFPLIKLHKTPHDKAKSVEHFSKFIKNKNRITLFK
jgi:hypothetical protein